MTSSLTPQTPSTTPAPSSSVSGYVALGLLILVIGLGGFGGWALLVPFEGAVIVSGQVKAERRNQIIKSLDGGILKELKIEEGDRLKKGQVIALLDDKEAGAQLNRFQASQVSLMAEQIRLTAERSSLTSPDFSSLKGQQDRDNRIQNSIAIQTSEFNSRKREITAEQNVLDRRISAVKREIEGIQTEAAAIAEQIALLDEELKDIQYLRKKKLARKGRILDIKRALSKAKAQQGERLSRLGQAEQRIAELQEQKNKITRHRQSEAATRLSAVTRELSELSEQINAATSLLARMTIRAPSDGIVVSVLNQTPGGVLKPGEDFIEILPLDQSQEIEAKLAATDIDTVKLGQKARLRFVIFPEKDVPTIDGEVSYISADSSFDRRTGQLEYQVRLRPTTESLASIDHDIMVPGSPVEAFITTRPRTFANYILEPLMANFEKTFRDTK
jgi:HlyD family secretion protein